MLTHRVLFDEQTIAARVDELAYAIAQDLPEPTPVLIGLLTGAFIFLADLVRALGRLEIEPQVDLMAVSHYGPLVASSGLVQLHKDSALDLDGRVVLLVDDILDSGRTLSMVRAHLAARNPRWLRTCVLLDKPSRRQVAINADYVGFEVPDAWMIGYGLDAYGQGRGLPYVAVLETVDPARMEVVRQT
ncbi:MAG: hypoxanthine phosphoribosyltransferase [candidate division NC10 bacterium]|nr:hypoxanthine phosphoribosyltransferase [candidate division NC10 bacterium]MDE2322136.1 hypoxanthine phosphoribosyltransferase [candidate division NC10 bacterium]